MTSGGVHEAKRFGGRRRGTSNTRGGLLKTGKSPSRVLKSIKGDGNPLALASTGGRRADRAHKRAKQ